MLQCSPFNSRNMTCSLNQCIQQQCMGFCWNMTEVSVCRNEEQRQEGVTRAGRKTKMGSFWYHVKHIDGKHKTWMISMRVHLLLTTIYIYSTFIWPLVSYSKVSWTSLDYLASTSTLRGWGVQHSPPYFISISISICSNLIPISLQHSCQPPIFFLCVLNHLVGVAF